VLDAGLPNDSEFQKKAMDAAAENKLRAFLLYDGNKPVSYLYCPVDQGALIYAYLGYDPEYRDLSVGTVLQWLALEELFGERRFSSFDFTEGQSPHKTFFATHQQLCANVLFVRRSVRMQALLYGHRLFDVCGERAGAFLERMGLKSKIRRLLRFGRAPATA